MTITGDRVAPEPDERFGSRPGPAIAWDPIDLGVDEPFDDGDGEPDRPQSRPPRRIRKRRLLALPVALALLATGAKTLTMTWLAREGASAYHDGQYGASRDQFNRLRTLNIVSPWKAWFDIGDAHYRQDDLAGAEEAFSRALAESPGRCDVRFNLAVTIEAQGDRLMGNNVRDVTDAEKLDGLAMYRTALDIVNAATCAVGGVESPGARLSVTRERLELKLGADESNQDESPLDEPDEDDLQQGNRNEQNQTLTEQLEDRNQSGERERQDASDVNPIADAEPREPNW